MLPILTSERLLLRAWTMDDVESAFVLYGDPEVTRHIGGITAADTGEMREQLAARIAKTDRYPDGQGAWAAFEGDTIVGCGLLKPLPDAGGAITDDVEVGWHLARRAWGRGLATEIGRRLVRFGLDELGLDTIHAVVEPPNTASMRVAERVGLRHVGQTTAYYGGLTLEHFVRSERA